MHSGNAGIADGGLRKKDKKDINDPFAVSTVQCLLLQLLLLILKNIVTTLLGRESRQENVVKNQLLLQFPRIVL